MRLRKALLKSFNSGNYTATVQVTSSFKAYLEDITVARNLPAAEMTAGRRQRYPGTGNIGRGRPSYD